MDEQFLDRDGRRLLRFLALLLVRGMEKCGSMKATEFRLPYIKPAFHEPVSVRAVHLNCVCLQSTLNLIIASFEAIKLTSTFIKHPKTRVAELSKPAPHRNKQQPTIFSPSNIFTNERTTTCFPQVQTHDTTPTCNLRSRTLRPFPSSVRASQHRHFINVKNQQCTERERERF